MRFACLPALLALAVALPCPALAQSPKDKARATALLKQGAELLEQKRYPEALERFEGAFAIVPSPKIQFNVGLAHEGLEQHAKAWTAYQKYLDGATSDAASRRTDAKKHQDGLRSRVAFVQVTSDTTGATIFIDGAEVGRTPQERPAVVDPGSHQALVSEGGRTWTRSFRADAGGSVTLDAVLNQPSAPIAPKLPELPRDGDPQGDGHGDGHVGDESPVVVDRAEPEPTPFYKRGWFWGVVGTVVVAGVITTVLVATSSTQIDRRCGIEGIECETWK